MILTKAMLRANGITVTLLFPNRLEFQSWSRENDLFWTSRLVGFEFY